MKKRTRILALAGAVLLIALYLATLIFALIGTSWAYAMFKMCIGFTIIIPVLIYVYQMIYRVLSGDKEDPPASRSQNNPTHKKGGRL